MLFRSRSTPSVLDHFPLHYRCSSACTSPAVVPAATVRRGIGRASQNVQASKGLCSTFVARPCHGENSIQVVSIPDRLVTNTRLCCGLFGKRREHLAALSRNEARVKRQSNVFGQARESGAARLSFAPPPALAGSSSSAARGRVFTHPPHPGRPPEVFPPTLAAHHWPRTVRGAGQRFALPPIPSLTPSPLVRVDTPPSLSPLVTVHERCPKIAVLSLWLPPREGK